MADTPWTILWDSADEAPDPHEVRREAWGWYVASREWAVLKRQVFARTNEGRCEHCDVRPASQVHHRTYHRRFQEDLADLMALCALCHLYLSGKIHTDPRLLDARDDDLTAA